MMMMMIVCYFRCMSHCKKNQKNWTETVV